MRPRRIGIGIGLLVALAAGWYAYRLYDERTFRVELERAKSEMLARHIAVAHRLLADLAKRKPGRGEVEFHLGVCELLRGRDAAALAAFERVPIGSEHAGWAAVHRAGVLQKRGQMAETESLLSWALERPGSHRDQARWELVRLLRLEGRFHDARRLFQAGLGEFEDPVAALRELYRLDADPYPAEGVRLYLDTAGRQAPQDDRVWLGRAYLATRTGDFAEADRWLQACLERRPDDPAVWRQRLDWALAAGRPEEVLESARHLPVDDDSESLALKIRAWFASRRGDRDAERSALESLLTIQPAAPRVLDRLAELAIAGGHPERAEELRLRKAALERAREDYRRQIRDRDPLAHAAELARDAEALGRRFEARQWSSLGAGLGVVSERKRPAASESRTLADLLPDRLSPATPPRPSGPTSMTTTPEVHFRDDADESGLRFVHESGLASGRPIPPITFSGGVALLDCDGDGWLDVFLVQSGHFPPGPSSAHGGDRLYRNRGDGTFEDVTERAGLGGSRGYGHGVTVGDFDNDGDPDLFVTRWRHYALYRNRGDGTFEDATEAAGLGGDRDWPTSAAFADLDNDGDLDLYVAHYLKWDEGDDRACTDPKDPSQYRCNPRDFPALPDHVFRNDDGRFVDVTSEAGIVDRDGRGLGVLAADLDDDGRTDLFVANDMTANYLFRNLGGFQFEEVAHTAGVAANAEGGYQAGMGVACGDLDGDGRLDLAVTNYYNESTSFFRGLGGGLFADHTAAIGLAAPSRFRLGFGLVLLDANNDGHLDLLTANGHVHDGRPQFPWKMPAQLLLGTNSGRVVDVTEKAGEPFLIPHIGRGLAVGDLDNDGRTDAVLQVQDEPVVFLHNRSKPGHFFTLRLEGTTSNRDAIGAVVTVAAGGRRQVLPRVGGGSYQSSSDPRIHAGLGDAKRIETLEVQWPSGRRDHFENLEADAGYLIREGEDPPLPLPGWPQRTSP